MAAPVYDPALPADHAPIVAGELRAQFAGLMDLIDSKVAATYVDGAIATPSAANCNAMSALGLTVSKPPTQAQMQSLAAKLDELINALRRP